MEMSSQKISGSENSKQLWESEYVKYGKCQKWREKQMIVLLEDKQQ
jgi:hypothetical protein